MYELLRVSTSLKTGFALSWVTLSVPPSLVHWFETILHGNFVPNWWIENFRLSRRTFEYDVPVAGLDLAYFFAMKSNVVENATK